MFRLLTRSSFVGLMCAGAGCGGAVGSHDRAHDAVGGNGGGGTVSDAAADGGSSAGGGACGVSQDASFADAPAAPGCYANTPNGWQKVPCNCELPLVNTTRSTVEVQLTLTVTPGNTAPSLTGSPDIEVAFEDADSSWYDAWASQVSSGSAFSVAKSGGTTTVRLGAIRVELDMVPLRSCQSRSATASVTGTFSETLHIEAVISDADAAVLFNTDGSCVNPPRP